MGTFYEDKTRYMGRITDHGLGKSKEKGTHFIFFKFDVLAKVVGPDQVQQVQSYERTTWRYLTDNTIEYALEDLKNADIFCDSWTQLDRRHPNALDLVGKEIDFYCQFEQDDKGRPREKWSIAKKFGSGPAIERLDLSDAKKLDSMYGAALRRANKERGGKPESAARTPTADAGSVITDDDLPF